MVPLAKGLLKITYDHLSWSYVVLGISMLKTT